MVYKVQAGFRKALKQGVQVGISLALGSQVGEVAVGVGLIPDPDHAMIGGTLLTHGVLEIVRNYLKRKVGLKFL